MGYDLYGRAPTSSDGEYLRRSAGAWAPMLVLLRNLCFEETNGCADWMYNAFSGEEDSGLDAAQANRLARRLEELQAEGAIDAYCSRQNGRATESYHVTPEDVDAFRRFVAASGGFVIE